MAIAARFRAIDISFRLFSAENIVYTSSKILFIFLYLFVFFTMLARAAMCLPIVCKNVNNFLTIFIHLNKFIKSFIKPLCIYTS